ncbi:hypothetical protein [Cellvibrio sp. NN19]|uniref:hypothetical protein n=1 Tax=Cellvibrio chitinivorans TaxID=3102792 RepID=UPI002B416FA8|nr:hypothetical protein [Cellvibrio sp. NN19]
MKATPKTASADVHITSLTLELPASLGARKHRIVRLLRSELMRLEWPKGDLARLDLPPLPLSCQQTNLAIARQLAQALITSAQRQLAQGGRL